MSSKIFWLLHVWTFLVTMSETTLDRRAPVFFFFEFHSQRRFKNLRSIRITYVRSRCHLGRETFSVTLHRLPACSLHDNDYSESDKKIPKSTLRIQIRSVGRTSFFSPPLSGNYKRSEQKRSAEVEDNNFRKWQARKSVCLSAGLWRTISQRHDGRVRRCIFRARHGPLSVSGNVLSQKKLNGLTCF